MEQSTAARYTTINCPLPANVVAYSINRLTDIPQTPSAPVWLRQVHGSDVVDAAEVSGEVEADASYTSRSNVVCVVKTADCLPILLCDKDGTQVAAIHAGWRSLAAGIIDNTCSKFAGMLQNCLAWLGPAIGPDQFYVDKDVLENFAEHGWNLQHGFRQTGNKWLVDLYTLARINLQQCGLSEQNIYGGGWCTYSEPELFYSYRRAKDNGRMQHLIWIK